MIQKIIRVFQVLTVALILLILVFPLFIYGYYKVFLKNKIYPKIFVNGINLSNKNKAQAIKVLQDNIDSKNINSLTLNYQDKKWTIPIEIKFDAVSTAEKAYQTAREDSLENDIIAKWHVWLHSTKLSYNYNLNNKLLLTSIASISNQINRPVVEPSVVITDNPKDIVIDPGSEGRHVDENQTLKIIMNHLDYLDKNQIDIPVFTEKVNIQPNQLDNIKLKAKKLLTKKIILINSDDKWELTDRELINFLAFKNEFYQQKIASYAAQLAKSIDKPAQNALFNFNNGKVVEFKPALPGQKLSEESTIKQIIEGIKTLESEEKMLTINLAISEIKPKIETKDVNNLDIKGLLGKGESWFNGSIPSRVYNINLAANTINGLLIPPEQTFSFNQAVGDVSVNTGFKPAYIIKEGRTILGDGGGICQVSTTLFRAALNAGLPIEERQAHAYRVGYYEQNSPPGIDATVFSPSVDFQFKNDTPSYILIQKEVDLNNSKLTFYLYGNSDGRQVYISPPRQWDQVPPPPDLYQDDPTMPQGIIKQIDWSAWGAKVSFDWKVVKDGNLLEEKTFFSYYRPWQAVYLKGTKTN